MRWLILECAENSNAISLSRSPKRRTPRQAGRSSFSTVVQKQNTELRLGDVGGLRTLLSLDNLELDAIAFRERLEAASLNGAEVDKDIRPSLARDKAVALASLNHFTVPWRRAMNRTSSNCFPDPLPTRASTRTAGPRPLPSGPARRRD